MDINGELRKVLIKRWGRMCARLWDSVFDSDEFKDIFRTTWVYFSNAAKNGGLALGDIDLINSMHDFCSICSACNYNTIRENTHELSAAESFVDNLVYNNISHKEFASGEFRYYPVTSADDPDPVPVASVVIVRPEGLDFSFENYSEYLRQIYL